MREPPPHVSDVDVLDVVRSEWDDRVDAVEHLPVGFGAHHWAATAQGTRRLFVTFDRLLPRRTAEEIEAAYAAAAELADRGGLEFVLATLRTRRGGRTVPLADGTLSVTPWSAGSAGSGPPADADEAEACATMLNRLHASPVPTGAPKWWPVVETSRFLPWLTGRLQESWECGPYGERSRVALQQQVKDIARWAATYDGLAAQALTTREAWVATHGEPDTGNQLVTPERRLLIDWESLKVAPRERDLRFLVEAGHPWRSAYSVQLDWAMVEMFDLEWRLDEISQYAAWFAAEHTGTESDAVAFEGLLHELTRKEWQRP